MAQPSPYKAQIFMSIVNNSGEDLISVIPPEHIVSFIYVSNLGGGAADNFEVELFDRDINIIENKIHKGTVLKLQWGYVGGAMSRVHTCKMMQMEITSVDGLMGVLMRITGFDEPATNSMNDKHTFPWHAPIHEIAKHIAENNGWGGKIGNTNADPEATIEECEDLPSASFSSKEICYPMNFIPQTDESDLTFLNRIRGGNGAGVVATSKHTHLQDFRLTVDDKKQLHFRPLRRTSDFMRSKQKKFVYPDPEGGVESFVPVLSAPLLSLMGAGTVVGRARDGISGEEIIVMRNATTLRVFMVDPKDQRIKKDVTDQLQGGLGVALAKIKIAPEFIVDFDTNAADKQLGPQQGRVIVGQTTTVSDRLRSQPPPASPYSVISLPQLTADSKEAAAMEVQAWWLATTAKYFQAVLTLVGDPTLTPTDFGTDVVDVSFFVKDAGVSQALSKQHFTSGQYQVWSVTHIIDQNGKYTTKLEMSRLNVFDVEPK